MKQRNAATEVFLSLKERISISISVGFVVVLGIAVAAVIFFEIGIFRQSPLPTGPEKQPAYVPGEFIVQFTEEAGRILDERLSPATLDIPPTQTGIVSLDELNGIHAVETITPVYSALKAEQVHAKKTWDQILEATRAKFPLRAQRATIAMPPPDPFAVYKFTVNERADIQTLCREFAKDPTVRYCQPNFWVAATLKAIPEEGGGGGGGYPNDPYFLSNGSWGQPPNRGDYQDLWGLRRIHSQSAWSISKGQDVTVAVVDTGLDYTHPDIAANVWINGREDLNHNGIVDGTNTCPTPSGDFNCIDDDANGYVDDLRGWNFASNNNNPMDGYGHGTHVSGTIAAVGNNRIGIIGVAPRARIMPVKGLDDSGFGTGEQLANALVYAALNGAEVINNSWACSIPCPHFPVVEDAVRIAHGFGATTVFAAGNASDDVSLYSPQNMTNPKPIVVAATDFGDQPTDFTNFGMLLDLAAPGGGTRVPPPSLGPHRNILSLKSRDCSLPPMCDPALIVGGDYLRQAGTSMAAPHVSGAAALIFAHAPSFTNDDVRQALRVSADDVGASGFDATTGAGRLNLIRAVTTSSVLRVSVTNPTNGTTLSQRMGSAAISGTASGPDFLQYELSYGQGAFPESWTPISTPVMTPVENGALGTWTIQSLTDGVYTLRLIATAGDGRQFLAFVQVSLEQNLPRQITDDPANQVSPSVDGHRIVWEDQRNGFFNPDIFLFDLLDGREYQITMNAAAQNEPELSGDWIVWHDQRNGNWDIYLYDLNTRTERQITSHAADQYSPHISGNRIVWQDTRDGNSEIYLCTYDAQTGLCPEQRITNHPGLQIRPDISGNFITWDDLRNGNWDIYLYDLNTSTEHQVTSNSGVQWYSGISGNRIVWGDSRDGGSNIFLCEYNAQTGLCTEQRLTSDQAGSPANPAISGQQVVWEDERHGNPEIYFYDLSERIEYRITSNLQEQYRPDIADGKIVWYDNRNYNFDIYLYDSSNRQGGGSPLFLKKAVLENP